MTAAHASGLSGLKIFGGPALPVAYLGRYATSRAGLAALD